MTTTTIKFERSLGLFSLVLFGLAYMTPMIVFGTYGVLHEASGGQVAGAYLFALIAMLFTAGSYALMARKYPVAGSSYTYVNKVFGDKVGFLIGWSILLDYLFLPMVIWLIGGIYLEAMAPTVPVWFWIVAFIVLTSLMNLVGFGVAKKVNLLMMVLQIGVIIAFCALAIAYFTGSEAAAVSAPVLNLDSTQLPLLFSGAAIACYSFLGFDAVSTMAEETQQPEKNVPRAILLVTLIGGSIFIAASWILQQTFADISIFAAESASADIATQVGGVLFSSIFVATLVVAQFTSGLSAQAGASRLMYAMGRDNVLPSSLFGKLHTRFKTPYVTIFIVGAIGLLALKMDVTTSTSFINFGAFIAFTFVNLCVIAEYFRLPAEQRTLIAKLSHLLMPAIGALCVLKLLVSLDENAVLLGGIWLAIGAAYLGYLVASGRQLSLDMKEV
jgi:amino acid transporter